jgi:hypothetical protein
MVRRRFVAGIGILLVAGCSGAMHQGGSTSPQENSSVIGAAELKDATYSNLYDLIQARRPRWLQGRVFSGGRLATPEVLMGNRELGGTDALREIPLPSVLEVRYYDPSSAQAVFGPEHTNGVIQVRSRPSP